MENPKGKRVPGWLPSLLIFGLLLIFGTRGCPNLNQGLSQTSDNNVQGIVQQQTEVPLEQQWELIQFENEAIELNGVKYDKGWFKNSVTGEVIEARCLDPTAPDPISGDRFFFNNEGKLERIGGGSQRFEKTFVVLATPTMGPTQMVATPNTTTSQGAISDTSDFGSDFLIPFSYIPTICGIMIMAMLMVAAFLRYNKKG